MTEPRSIWKFPLALMRGNPQPVDMPAGAHVVSFAMQDDVPTLWAIIDPDAPKVTRQFHVLGTGRSIPLDLTYIGTALHGPFVWHAFEAMNAGGIR